MSNLTPSQQPVIYATVVQTILAALVAAGWATIPDATVNTIASCVGGLLALGAAWLARRNVTPVSKVQAIVERAKVDAENVVKVAQQVEGQAMGEVKSVVPATDTDATAQTETEQPVPPPV